MGGGGGDDGMRGKWGDERDGMSDYWVGKVWCWMRYFQVLWGGGCNVHGIEEVCCSEVGLSQIIWNNNMNQLA